MVCLIDWKGGCIIKSDSVFEVIRESVTFERKFLSFDLFNCNIFRVNQVDKGLNGIDGSKELEICLT